MGLDAGIAAPGIRRPDAENRWVSTPVPTKRLKTHKECTDDPAELPYPRSPRPRRRAILARSKLAQLIAYFQEKVKAHLWWKCQELCLGVCGWRIVTGEPILPVIALRK